MELIINIKEQSRVDEIINLLRKFEFVEVLQKDKRRKSKNTFSDKDVDVLIKQLGIPLTAAKVLPLPEYQRTAILKRQAKRFDFLDDTEYIQSNPIWVKQLDEAEKSIADGNYVSFTDDETSTFENFVNAINSKNAEISNRR